MFGVRRDSWYDSVSAVDRVGGLGETNDFASRSEVPLWASNCVTLTDVSACVSICNNCVPFYRQRSDERRMTSVPVMLATFIIWPSGSRNQKIGTNTIVSPLLDGIVCVCIHLHPTIVSPVCCKTFPYKIYVRISDLLFLSYCQPIIIS
jgi:hypothetical protein